MGEGQKETISYRTAKGELIKTLTPIGEVDSENYKGRDRRTNGARLKLATRDWIAIGGIMFALLSSSLYIKFTVSAHSTTIQEHTLKISTLERDIGTIKSDVSYIRGFIDKIK